MAGRRLALGAVAPLLALAGSTMSACGETSSCRPALLQATPATVLPGEPFTLVAPPAECRLSPATYSLRLVAGRPPIADIDLGTVEVGDTGELSTTITVPPDMASGVPAAVVVSGSAYDASCDDTSSCPTYGAQLTIE